MSAELTWPFRLRVEHPEPLRRPLLTQGVAALVLLMIPGLCVMAWRFAFGLEAVTHLDQQHPWGLWIAIDVATGVALAAGGFTSAALVHVFHQGRFHALVRPALLTALLGYTFVGLGLLVDLGRYYNIWHPILPIMWQGNSVLFEVGLCVVCYITVLYLEFAPVVCEAFLGQSRFPRLATSCQLLHRLLGKVLILLILAGIVLSCLHQSSLGNLMVIAPSKMHPLWYTPILAWLFLLSAMAVGFPMVIVESLFAAWAFKLKPEIELLGRLARFIPPFLGLYLAFKIGDLLIREAFSSVDLWSTPTLSLLLELGGGVLLPMLALCSSRVRGNVWGLGGASLLIVLGVALNRVNVFLVAYRPPFAEREYFPSFGEFAVTVALLSGLVLLYRVIVTFTPVLARTPGATST